MSRFVYMCAYLIFIVRGTIQWFFVSSFSISSKSTAVGGVRTNEQFLVQKVPDLLIFSQKSLLLYMLKIY